MKTATLVGKKRDELGKGPSGRLRKQGLIPCVITRRGTDAENIHFYSFINDLKPLVYTPDTYKISIDVEGTKVDAIIQEAQFNPLSDEVRHLDFLEVFEDQPIRCEIPVKFVGNSPGVQAGGKLAAQLRKLKVFGLIKDMPDTLDIDISEMQLGGAVKVRDLSYDNLEIVNPAPLPVAVIEIPRALKSAAAK